ncbi:MAG: class I SAM-dependent methyltransferase [Thermoplasmata archaeon]|nr:class I SAM-dependent methyltransferase [Thermoplasmata archaeon]
MPVSQIVDEFSGLRSELRLRYQSIRPAYPSNWAIEEGTSLLVYAVVRRLKPEKVLETGVANGHSSFFILRALESNGRGRLFSVDIDSAAGSLLSPRERANWRLLILPKSGRKAALREFVQGMRPADMFLHDSNHTYHWQMFEFELARQHLRSGGYIMTDDAELSFAFIDFAKKYRLSPMFLEDRRKKFGVVQV